mmetsp:Transcript_28883/g.89938  ORF Transcript_28883/g.89938 Transcript_28883/m.89938 type:complete len:114 (+) Transcript_28883:391-732(+)
MARCQGVDAFDVQRAVWEALFEEAENFSSSEVLARIAGLKLGLDEEDVLRYLESDAGTQEVVDEAESASRRYGGVSSVPHFVVSGAASSQQYSFTGAHPSEQFLDLFKRVCEE